MAGLPAAGSAGAIEKMLLSAAACAAHASRVRDKKSAFIALQNNVFAHGNVTISVFTIRSHEVSIRDS